jgi:hypothetical protein
MIRLAVFSAVLVAFGAAAGAVQAASVQSGPVFIGNYGQVNGTTMACPNQQDIINFMQSYVASANAKDTVGEEQDIHTALQAGCASFRAGDTGFVINSSGLEQYDEVRMDSDQSAYWLPAKMMSPIPG